MLQYVAVCLSVLQYGRFLKCKRLSPSRCEGGGERGKGGNGAFFFGVYKHMNGVFMLSVYLLCGACAMGQLRVGWSFSSHS